MNRNTLRRVAVAHLSSFREGGPQDSGEKDRMLSYTIDPPYVVVTAARDLTSSEIRRLLLTMASDSRIPEKGLLLIDARATTAMPTHREIQEQFGFFRVLAGRTLPIAAIVTAPTQQQGVGLLFQLEARARGSVQVGVFTDMEQSRRWLRENAETFES